MQMIVPLMLSYYAVCRLQLYFFISSYLYQSAATSLSSISTVFHHMSGLPTSSGILTFPGRVKHGELPPQNDCTSEIRTTIVSSVSVLPAIHSSDVPVHLPPPAVRGL